MRGLLAVSLVLATAMPAGATEWIVCAADGDKASVDLLVGLGLDVAAISQARLEAGGRKWATDGEGEQKISIGQAFEDGEKLIVDFTDEAVSTVVASLRLFKASENEDFATGGTLRVAGVGAWPVACSGP